MDIRVGEAESAFIETRVRSGRNADAVEVIVEALRLLSQRDRERDELRAAVQPGIDDADAGRVIPWTPGLPNEIREEVQARMSSSRRTATGD